MAKSKRKRKKQTIAIKKEKLSVKGKNKTVELVNCLLELHKIQGSLMNQLSKEVKNKLSINRSRYGQR